MSNDLKKYYNCETIAVHPNDVILVHLSDHVDVGMANEIMKYMSETFPENKSIAVNKYLLEGLTILRPTKEQVVQVESVINKTLEEMYPDLFTKKIGDFL